MIINDHTSVYGQNFFIYTDKFQLKYIFINQNLYLRFKELISILNYFICHHEVGQLFIFYLIVSMS